jgi:hypothetical protein
MAHDHGKALVMPSWAQRKNLIADIDHAQTRIVSTVKRVPGIAASTW